MLNNDSLKPEFLEKELNFLLYNSDDYIFKYSLGEGTFGKVYLCYRKKDSSYVAIKFINTQRRVNSEEELMKIIENLTSLIIEFKIMEKLNIQKSLFTSRLDSKLYRKNEDGIADVILVTSAGNCSLQTLIDKRKISHDSKSPYDEAEAISILIQLLEGLIHLKEARIYHSDLKPENIVVNANEKCYQFIDFGTSHIIPLDEDIIPFDPYASAGTYMYISPEKRKVWNFWKEWDGEDESQKDAEYNQGFNPFLCDVWSLGKTLLAILGGELDLCSRKMKALLKYILVEDWRERKQAANILQYVFSLGFGKSNAGISEEEIKIIQEFEKNKTPIEEIFKIDNDLKNKGLREERYKQLKKEENYIQTNGFPNQKEDFLRRLGSLLFIYCILIRISSVETLETINSSNSNEKGSHPTVNFFKRIL
jgi:serine/threonine protein kinase